MRILAAFAGLVALTAPVAEAYAQLIGTVRVRAGLGAQVRPDWKGSDQTEWAPYPDVSIAFGDKPFGFDAPDDSFDVALYSKKGFSIGPALAIEGRRKESDVGAAVGKVPTTVEAGVFAQHYISSSFRVRGELRHGLGGHEGLVGSIGADKIWRDGDDYVFSIGPRLVFSNARYQRAYFGVGSEAALASGLPVYRPDGGLHALAATSGMHYSIGKGWGLFGYARYERLVGDARKSPIVRQLGSPNQFSAGLGISHTFAIDL